MAAKMGAVQVPADVLAALIRVYKRQYDAGKVDPEAMKIYNEVHRLEFTATRKLAEYKTK
jgi:hypothetical protein